MTQIKNGTIAQVLTQIGSPPIVFISPSGTDAITGTQLLNGTTAEIASKINVFYGIVDPSGNWLP